MIMGKKKDISYNSPQDGAGENKLIQALKERITSLEYQIE